jgi:hypothetical protein
LGSGRVVRGGDGNVVLRRPVLANGPADALASDDIVEAAIAHDQLMHGHAITPHTGPTLRRLAELRPRRLALMHGPTFVGDGAAVLDALADYFDAVLVAAMQVRAPYGLTGPAPAHGAIRRQLMLFLALEVGYADPIMVRSVATRSKEFDERSYERVPDVELGRDLAA